MKLLRLIGFMAVMAAAIPATSRAAILVPWDQSWAYFHPVNNDNPSALDAALALNDFSDPDFYSTWFLKADPGETAGERPAGYDGPSFAGPSVAGWYDRGVGAGPLGYRLASLLRKSP